MGGKRTEWPSGGAGRQRVVSLSRGKVTADNGRCRAQGLPHHQWEPPFVPAPGRGVHIGRCGAPSPYRRNYRATAQGHSVLVSPWGNASLRQTCHRLIPRLMTHKFRMCSLRSDIRPATQQKGIGRHEPAQPRHLPSSRPARSLCAADAVSVQFRLHRSRSAAVACAAGGDGQHQRSAGQRYCGSLSGADGGQMVQIARPNDPETIVAFQGNFAQFAGDGSYTCDASLFIPTGQAVAQTSSSSS